VSADTIDDDDDGERLERPTVVARHANGGANGAPLPSPPRPPQLNALSLLGDARRIRRFSWRVSAAATSPRATTAVSPRRYTSAECLDACDGGDDEGLERPTVAARHAHGDRSDRRSDVGVVSGVLGVGNLWRGRR
jgi:hypothetical protein